MRRCRRASRASSPAHRRRRSRHQSGIARRRPHDNSPTCLLPNPKDAAGYGPWSASRRSRCVVRARAQEQQCASSGGGRRHDGAHRRRRAPRAEKSRADSGHQRLREAHAAERHRAQYSGEWHRVAAHRLHRGPNRPADTTTWFEFDRLNFATGSASILPESDEQIDNIVAMKATNVK